MEFVVSERTDELRRAIEQLREELVQRTLAEKRFEDVIESAPDAMFVLDQSGEILLINAMAERLFGFPREELIGMNIASNLIPVRYREQERLYFQEFLMTPRSTNPALGWTCMRCGRMAASFPWRLI